MKWKGTVAQSCSWCMTARFARAKSPQAISGSRCCAVRKAVAGMANGLDHTGAELGTEAAVVDIDDIGPWVEGAAPDIFEQLGARAHLALVDGQVLEQEELAGREPDRPGAAVGRAAVRVEGQAAGAQQAVAGGLRRQAQARPDAGD